MAENENQPPDNTGPAVQPDGSIHYAGFAFSAQEWEFVKAYERDFSLTLDEAVANVIYAMRIRRG